MSPDAPADPLAERLQESGALTPVARRVTRFIAENRALALACSAAELARRTGTSDASVIRAVQALGFAGLPELRRALAESLGASPAAAMRETLAEAGAEIGGAVELVLATQREAVEALASAQQAIRDAVGVLQPAARILAFGLGPSASLARYAALLLGRAGRRAGALDGSGIALADQMLDLAPGDALLVLAYDRAYREVTALFAEARLRRLPIVLVTDSLEERLARQAAVVIPARRGRARRVALHGATLVALEALVLGLAVAEGGRAVAALERLNDLRAAILGQGHAVG